MENLEKSSVDDPTDDIKNIAKKLEEKSKEQLDPTEIKEMFNELGKDSKKENDLADLFYKSVKMIFDLGFDLANKLNFELLNSFAFDKEIKEGKDNRKDNK